MRAEVFCFSGDKVLCADGPGYLMFPGGGVDPNESAVEAAKREAKEEADRTVTGCAPAHPPTTQLWSKEYKARRAAWAKGHDGGLTYWMTGSCGALPDHVLQADRHKDYVDGFAFRPVAAALETLKKELATSQFPDDVRTRLAILETHVQMNEAQKAAALATRVSGVPLFFTVPARRMAKP